MRAKLYDILGLGFLLGSAYFFVRTIEFLAQADYVAAMIALTVGFLVVRAGVDLARLALAASRED
ncbi:hypothetical protein DL240_08630 [Lujinxingia litoralis]|uniref:Uncharacterized protein n=1 Tax=Lujinxingia litoralis TaxID=2211119 RepID=A0A328CBQ5_9DELT|nr:hypothetical protein [Lujinxingia litoralis]RAL22947.1 hypothetical protein DL240_08630 [Lujinxingia litoralis]